MLLGGIAVVVVSAWVVPVSLTVSSPGRLVAVQELVTLSLSPAFVEAAASSPQPVTGQFLAPRDDTRPSLARVIAALAWPTHVVHGATPAPRDPVEQPATVAALLGLGLSPGRMQGTDLPVAVRVDARAEPASVGLLLHVFDAAAQRDVARGRRIAGIGVMDPDLALRCPRGADDSVAAAVAGGVEVIVVPSSCAATREVAPSAVIVRASTFLEAVDALLAGEAAGSARHGS